MTSHPRYARVIDISAISHTRDISSWLWSLMTVGFIVAIMMVVEPGLLHWFVLPVALCGLLIGVDAVDWIRGRFDVFDSIGIFGLFGLHFFFLAPLLHVYWERWIRNVIAPEDWRYWLGQMAIYNFLGLIAYRIGRAVTLRKPAEERRPLNISITRWSKVFPVALGVTALIQAWVYLQFGGLSGFMDAAVSGAAGADTTESLQGFGIIFLVSESFPILALFAYSIWARRSGREISWREVFAVLAIFLVLRIFFGGLRGSRGNIIYSLIWATGVMHLMVRRFPRRLILAGLLLVISFAYVYGFYKSFGREGLSEILDPAARSQLESRGNRSLETVLLGDLGRADIQAFILYSSSSVDSTQAPPLGLGQTYLGSLTLLVPSFLLPVEIDGKVEYGTDYLYGNGAHDSGMYRATYAYGLSGEAMMNFGPLAVPAGFFAFGLIMGTISRAWKRSNAGDIQLLMLPFLTAFGLILFFWDSDIVIFFLVKNAALPAFILFLCSTRSDITTPTSSRSIPYP